MSGRPACPCCGGPLPEDAGFWSDPESGAVVADGRVAFLTRREMEFFDCLVERRPKFVSKETLYSAAYWQREEAREPDPKIVDVLICKIRAKLQGMPLDIRTDWGRGYGLVVLAESEAA